MTRHLKTVFNYRGYTVLPMLAHKYWQETDGFVTPIQFFDLIKAGDSYFESDQYDLATVGKIWLETERPTRAMVKKRIDEMLGGYQVEAAEKRGPGRPKKRYTFSELTKRAQAAALANQMADESWVPVYRQDLSEGHDDDDTEWTLADYINCFIGDYYYTRKGEVICHMEDHEYP